MDEQEVFNRDEGLPRTVFEQPLGGQMPSQLLGERATVTDRIKPQLANDGAASIPQPEIHARVQIPQCVGKHDLVIAPQKVDAVWPLGVQSQNEVETVWTCPENVESTN